jgi:hypothetical protein
MHYREVAFIDEKLMSHFLYGKYNLCYIYLSFDHVF